MAASNEAQIWGVLAASGSGKGVWIKHQLTLLNPQRLVIWDYKDEYGQFAPLLVHNTEQVRAAMMNARDGPLRIRYKCKPGTSVKQTMKEFETLCRLVQAWGNCVFLAEELSNVTTPSWAPPAWREMTTGGRHESVHIIGVAQNPALIDKTFLSNCTLIHVGPLREMRHRQAVARSMDVPVEDVTALVQFQYIERDFNTREVRHGWVESRDPKVCKAIAARRKQQEASCKHAPTPRGRRASATGSASALQQGGGTDGIGVSEPSNQPRGKPK